MNVKSACSIAAACAAAAAAWVHAGSVRVPEAEDLVRLVNGEVIAGTVLCRGPRKIVVLVDAGEVDIDPSRVVSIRKVQTAGKISSFITAPVDGTERIVGRGAAPVPAASSPAGTGKGGASADVPGKGTGGGAPARGAGGAVPRGTGKKIRALLRNTEAERILKDLSNETR